MTEDDTTGRKVSDMHQTLSFAHKARFPISVERYHQMIEDGDLDEHDRVELVEGVLIEMVPQSPEHVDAVSALREMLENLGTAWHVRVQGPLTLAASEPEPDLAVCPRPLRDASRWHPTTASLVVEVARTSRKTDRAKAAIYARAGVIEYWIIDVRDRVVERYREPVDGQYRTVDVVERGQVISPVALPDRPIEIRRLFARG